MLSSLLLLFLAAASANEEKCGFASCTKHIAGMLNVHIVPHTHDDVGWLKTVDQYYYGSRNDIQNAGVQYILDSVVEELWKNPDRRFIYVETAYFWRWWNLQTEDTKQKVHTLVAGGRLKFAGGAWSMNDEATTYYQSTIDQFTLGLSKLNETFGSCGVPAVAWQIDPFGHSREFANMLAAMGYDGLFLGRIDYQDKAARLRDKRMEMIWIGDDTLDFQDAAIFTSVLYNTYSAPEGFCFDVLCEDTPIIDDRNSPDYNVDEKVDLFLSYVKNMSKSYVTYNVLVPMGGDFNYMQAGMWYNNLDKLIQYGNLKAAKDGLNMNLFYSTPDCYMIAVNDEEPWLPVKYDDFFPYASDPHSYWTGYYTSRAAIKYLEAQTNVYLQMVKQLQFLVQSPNDFQPVVDNLKTAMGVMQHHDAITGTERQHVANDYVRMLTKAAADAHAVPTAALNKIMNVTGQGLEPLVFDRCKFNESSCTTSEKGGNFIVTVYNPLAWRVRAYVDIPLLNGTEYYVVNDGKGTIIRSQVKNLPDFIKKIPQRVSNATRGLTFYDYIPPLGFKSYYVTKLDPPPAKSLLKTRGLNANNVEEFEKLFEDSTSGPKRLRDVVNPYNNIDDEECSMLSDDPMVVTMYQAEELAGQGLPDQKTESTYIMTVQDNTLHVRINKREILVISIVNYPAVVGNNMVSENRSSGAYVFRPGAVIPTKLIVGNETIVDGEIYSEVRLTTLDNGGIRCRIYKCGGVLVKFITYLIGPLNVHDNKGKEFGLKYHALNVTTNGEFRTDSNGRQILTRKLDKRPEWNLTLEEPVAGNYYPVVGGAGYKGEGDDGEVYLNILTDRAEGAASLQEGAIELMMHRRLLHDDGFGVGEALNETFEGEGLALTITHRVFLNPWDIKYKDMLENRLQPQVFVSDAIGLERTKWEKLVTEYSWLDRSFPNDIHLLTTEVRNGSLLLRLENCLEKPQEVKLGNILKNIEVKSVRESLLAANVWETTKLSWNNVVKTKNSDTVPNLRAERYVKADDGFRIQIKGKQIRTFVVEYERKDLQSKNL